MFMVIKRDANGIFQLEYKGEVREWGETWVCIDAVFGFSDRDLGYIRLCKGDLFTEWFFTDRWFNIFRVQDVHTQALKGWYCNITRPAEISENSLAADDLALDVFVYPDGRILLLDEDEFDALDLSPQEREIALSAVEQIKKMVAERQSPFDEIPAK